MAKPYLRGRIYWIAPWINGKQVPQSTGCKDYTAADRKLKILEGKIAANAPITAKTDRESFACLLELVRQHYALKRYPSMYALQIRIKKHLMPALGHLPAAKVDTVTILNYMETRQAEGASDASINRELAIIKRGFKLGSFAGLVSTIPHIEMFQEDNARQGFFAPEAFQSALRHATNDLLRGILIVAYYTGWRLSSVLKLEWQNVDFASGAIRLFSRNTKNKKPTIFPLAPFPELGATLETRWNARKDLIPYVFHIEGRRVRRETCQKWWEKTRERAGLPGLIIHDLRRTAVRDLLRQGWAKSDIKNMCGIKTDSIFDRYNITTEEDIMRKGQEMAARAGVIWIDKASRIARHA